MGQSQKDRADSEWVNDGVERHDKEEYIFRRSCMGSISSIVVKSRWQLPNHRACRGNSTVHASIGVRKSDPVPESRCIYAAPEMVHATGTVGGGLTSGSEVCCGKPN